MELSIELRVCGLVQVLISRRGCRILRSLHKVFSLLTKVATLLCKEGERLRYRETNQFGTGGWTPLSLCHDEIGGREAGKIDKVSNRTGDASNKKSNKSTAMR